MVAAASAILKSRCQLKFAPGTLAIIAAHGVGNPRDCVSGRFSKLLKFQPLKLKEIRLKKAILTASVTMAFCVDDYGHLQLSTESTCQPT